eukprot:g6948.t1
MKFAQNKQINEGRLWDLALPRHMPEIVKHNTNHTNFNFQKVIFGLDASVQIYSRRVDSIHNSALDARCRLTEKNGVSIEETENEVEVAPTRRQRRHSNFEGDSTIVTNLDQITSKAQNEDILPIDPLFQKTSALFDAGGFKGLPTLNRGLSYGGRYVLDKNEAPNGDVKQTCVLPPMHEMNLEVFGISFEMATEQKPISESSMKLSAMLGLEDQSSLTRDVIAQGKNSVILKPGQPEQVITEEVHFLDNNEIEDFEIEVDGEVEIQAEGGLDEEGEIQVDDDLNAMPDNGDFNAPGALLQILLFYKFAFSDFPSHEMRLSFEVADALNIPHETEEVEVLDEATIGWLLDVTHDQKANKGRAWTGSVHWKYPTASKVHTEEERDTQQKKKPTKKELDYTQLPETNILLFKKPAKQSSSSMLFKDDAESILPIDHKFNSSFILPLTLFTLAKPQEWLGRLQRRTRGLPGFHHETHEFGEMDHDEFGGLDIDGENDYGIFEAPEQIDEEHVQVDLMPAKVNMHQLKSDLWSRINSMGKNNAEISFDALVSDLMQSGDISVGLCFSGSLHLAAEHGFHITNKTSLDVSILLQTAASSDNLESIEINAKE